MSVLPPTIRTMLNNEPLLPHENREDFIGLFLELEHSPGAGIKAMSEYLMLFEATRLTVNLQRLKRQRVHLMRHAMPAAVLNLHIRAGEHGTAEPGSVAHGFAISKARAFFASEQGQKDSAETFRKAGYSHEAVEAESYVQAQPLLVAVERQITVAERLLMSYLKELDRRFGRRDEMRKAAAKALARGRTYALQNTDQVDGN